MTTLEALQNRERCLEYLEGCKAMANPECVEAVRLSVIALREKLEREKSDPLTVEELQQMTEPTPVCVNAMSGWEWYLCKNGRINSYNGFGFAAHKLVGNGVYLQKPKGGGDHA